MTQPSFEFDAADWEAAYQGRPPDAGVNVSFDTPPFDIGEPQPVVVALADSGALGGEVLDIGCGPGNNAVFLVECGYRVTGIDWARAALRIARQRAQEHGVAVEFVHADATTLQGVPQRFNAVLDSALYICLSDAQRSAYAAALHRVTMPGAQLHLFCLADTDSPGIGQHQMAVSRDNLREHLATHWDIRSIEPADYTLRLTYQDLEHTGADRFQLVGGWTIDPTTAPTDHLGRILAPFWHLHAERR